jgi:hypothetical protein
MNDAAAAAGGARRRLAGPACGRDTRGAAIEVGPEQCEHRRGFWRSATADPFDASLASSALQPAFST